MRESGCGLDSKLPFSQPDLAHESLIICPEIELSFLQHPHDFESFDRGKGGFHGLESKGGLDQAFEFAVIGLNSVVEVFTFSMKYLFMEKTFFLKGGSLNWRKGYDAGYKCSSFERGTIKSKNLSPIAHPEIIGWATPRRR